MAANSRVPPGLSGFQRTATRDTVGTISLRISSRFAASSVERNVMPVTLPPGRARLDTSPPATGSPAATITIGIVDVARRGGIDRGVARRHDYVHLALNQNKRRFDLDSSGCDDRRSGDGQRRALPTTSRQRTGPAFQESAIGEGCLFCDTADSSRTQLVILGRRPATVSAAATTAGHSLGTPRMRNQTAAGAWVPHSPRRTRETGATRLPRTPEG